jgi:energy-coupling factor transporter transmembrane protein EcfT
MVDLLRGRLGPLGYLASGLASMAGAIVAQGWHTALALAVSVVLAVVLYPSALRRLRGRRFLLFTTLLVVSSALFLEEEGLAWHGWSLSTYGLENGGQMVLRAAAILVAVGGILERVGVSQLASMLERLGLGGLGFAFGVALNSLPALGETAGNATAALRLRGGFRRERLRAVRQLFLTILTNSLRYGDQVVAAAEARAYSPERARPLPLRWSWVDIVLAGGLLAIVVALWLL